LDMSSLFFQVIGVMCATFLSIRFGKKAIVQLGFFLTAVFMIAFILLPPDAIWATFILEYIRALSFAPTIPLLWAMFADVADYAEWKTGRRTTGVIYATIMFGLKAGLSLGGAMTGWILGWYGYKANVAQTPTALMGIRLTVSVYPAIFFMIVVVCMFFYRISKNLNIQIQDELAERRKSFAPAAK
jgi:glycoside/pentoside/hexuronide:cation symporter, GPH family